MNDDSQHRQPFSWKARGRSFGYALKGLGVLIRDEHNARIHLCAAIAAIAAGVWLGISAAEWCLVGLCIGAVIMAEALNSAVEALADYAAGEKRHPLIGKAKDVAAAGVLVMAMAALTCGLIIFLPKIIRLVANNLHGL